MARQFCAKHAASEPSCVTFARTTRGYRKASHGFRASVVQATSQPHMRSVATVLASATLMTGQGVKTQKEVKNSAKNPAQYTSAERWSYMQEGKQVFSDAGVIGLTCDAVHIGDSDWLNCILWNADRAVGYVCPPQAGGIGKFQQFLNFVWLHFFLEKPCGNLLPSEHWNEFSVLMRFPPASPLRHDPHISKVKFSSRIPASPFPPASPLPK